MTDLPHYRTRDLPNRPEGLNWELLGAVGACVAFWAVVITALVKGCAS